jgi:hypothetical protein
MEIGTRMTRDQGSANDAGSNQEEIKSWFLISFLLWSGVIRVPFSP